MSAEGKTDHELEYETEMKARVHITLKHGVLDPQGKAIGNALQSPGLS